MQARRVDFGKGLAWYGEGWKIFQRNPGMWIVLVVLLLAISALLHLVPLLGSMVLALVFPGLIGGMLYGAREALEQREMDISHLLRAFKQNDTRNSMLMLGVVTLGTGVAFVITLLVVVGGAMGMMAAADSHHEMLAAGLGMAMLAALLLLTVFGLLLSMALFYAVPLVMFAGTRPAAAIASSFAACLVNILPLSLFGIVYLALLTIAVIPFGLGLLVLLPVTFGAIYASYCDVYSAPAA